MAAVDPPAAEKVEPVLVDAAQIATPQRHAVTIEEFENLNGDLAAVVEPVAELGGGELPGLRFCCQIGGRFHHLRHGAAKNPAPAFAVALQGLARAKQAALDGAWVRCRAMNRRFGKELGELRGERHAAFRFSRMATSPAHRSADIGRSADCLRSQSCDGSHAWDHRCRFSARLHHWICPCRATVNHD